jgi:dTDP-4-dehydrorhamnose reductase
MKKILVTGGNSRFAIQLRKIKTNYIFIYKNKNQLNINSLNSIEKNIKKFKPNSILHLAGLSRPMSLHDKKISKSIDLNIIGTCNLVKACLKYNIKLIYFSTSYVYEGTKGNYKEIDPILPWNNYAWSKLGGESAVQMYKNSLILRVCMTEKPFIHKMAYANVKTNFIYQQDLAKKLIKLISKKGIYNIGGEAKTIYKFALKENKNIKKKISKGEFPKKMDMNISKMNKILKK